MDAVSIVSGEVRERVRREGIDPGRDADEIRRLTEDKAFDIGPMRAVLRVEPVPLAEGLARTFIRPRHPAR